MSSEGCDRGRGAENASPRARAADLAGATPEATSQGARRDDSLPSDVAKASSRPWRGGAASRRASRVGTAAAKPTGAAVGKRAVDRAANARLVADTIERTHPAQAATAASRPEFVKDRAGAIKKAAQEAARQGKRAGGREQVKGHFIEALDVQTYGAKGRAVGKKLVPRKGSTNKAYDASRVVKKKFAGAVQQKSSAAGTEKAIAQMEKVKPGSARRGTLRVPRDQVGKARVRARGRIRVKGMEFTSEQAGSKLDQGLGDLAKKGSMGSSAVRATARGAAVGAAVNIVMGVASETGALRRGEIDTRDFAESRAVDAAEGATNAVVGIAAASVGGAAGTAALGTSAGAAAAVSAGAAGTAALGAITGMGAAGAAVGAAISGVTVAAAAPAIIGGAAVLGSGVLVGKGYERVRRLVRASQEARRQLAAAAETQAIPGAALDENGEPIVDAVVVDEVVREARRGRDSFATGRLTRFVGSSSS